MRDPSIAARQTLEQGLDVAVLPCLGRPIGRRDRWVGTINQYVDNVYLHE